MVIYNLFESGGKTEEEEEVKRMRNKGKREKITDKKSILRRALLLDWSSVRASIRASRSASVGASFDGSFGAGIS